MPSDQSPTQIRPSTTAKVEQSMGLPPPRQTDPIACPRCESTNTKFCYYNNYNLSQPRHFCKTCRRYWTLGGTLRNVPVGGGYRKNNAKRSRSSNSSSSGSPSSSSLTQEVTSVAVPVNPAVPTNSISPLAATTLETASDHDQIMDLIENVEGIGGFTSLLNCQAPAAAPPPLFLALSGYGYGSGPTHGFDEVGNFGYGGGGVWAFPEVGDLPASVNANNSNKNVASSASNGCNTWQMVTGSESGLGDGDCFAWPELEISSTSTGGKVFK